MKSWHWGLILSGVAALLALAAPDDEFSGPVDRRSARPQHKTLPTDTSKAQAQDQPHLLGRLAEPPMTALFELRSWEPPAQAPSAPISVAAAAPTVAVIPPLPYRLVGRLQQEHGTVFLLEREGRGVMGSLGDTIDGSYRIESADDMTLTFRYLPMDQLQSLTMPSRP